MFPGTWTGAEMTSMAPFDLPAIRLLASRHHHAVAAGYLWEFLHGRASVIPRDAEQLGPAAISVVRGMKAFGNSTGGLSFTAEEWALAVRLSSADDAAITPVLDRKSAVCCAIADHCLRGDLSAWERPVAGGSMTRLAPEFWNTESWHSRFETCTFEPSAQFNSRVLTADAAYIFVGARSLAKVEGRLTDLRAPHVRLTMEDARQIIENAIGERGGFISQSTGVELIRAADPTFDRGSARALTKEFTRNSRPGPRGPRTPKG